MLKFEEMGIVVAFFSSIGNMKLKSISLFINFESGAEEKKNAV